MTTSLGSHPQGVRLAVRNTGATTLVRGTIVTFNSVAASNPAVLFMDGTMNKDYQAGGGVAGTVRQIDIPIIPVLASGNDAATPGLPGRVGVLAADILPGKDGEAITYGLARVFYPAAAAITVGSVVTSNASGFGRAAANANDDNAIGIVVETVDATAGLRWTFVNCLVPGGTAGALYMGKAF